RCSRRRAGSLLPFCGCGTRFPERGGGCSESVLLKPGTLGFRSRGERLKVEAADPAETSSFQRKPERALALDADGEAFQLDKARQGRVTPQFTIQLQSPEL